MFSNFREWIQDEAVRHHFQWSDEDIPTDRTNRDYMGLPKLARPGFRPQDKIRIQKEHDQTEKWLNGVTSRYGIHWVVVYGEPNPGENDDAAGWNSYSSRMAKIGQDQFQQLVSSWRASHPEEKPPSPENTIVYVKPTSRVHGLSSHQQVHNIGHAIWGHCGDLKQLFLTKLREIVEEVQQSAHDKGGDPPTWGEVILVLSRLVKLASFRRVFEMKPGDFEKPAKLLNQVYGSLDEFMYELIAAFFRGGGYLYLKPREGLAGDLEPSQAIAQHDWPDDQWKKPRDWVWKALSQDQALWEKASQQLTGIVVTALTRCTYGRLGRPIYATYKSLTTEP